MSHYTLLVVTDHKPTDDELELLLEPYEETPKGENAAKYCVFKDCDAEARATMAETSGLTLEQFAQDYGYVIQNDRLGYMHNPKSRWDWWVIGGRWSGSFGKDVDQIRRGDLDLEARLADRTAERLVWLNETMERLKLPDLAALSERWDRYRAAIVPLRKSRPEKMGFAEHIDDLAAKGDVNAQLLRSEEMARMELELGYFGLGVPEHKTLGEWLQSATPISAFAILKDGVWHQKGQMGWFGIVHDEQDEWQTQFDAIFSTVRDDQWLTMIDCHI